jgi:hypothetical protein
MDLIVTKIRAAYVADVLALASDAEASLALGQSEESDGSGGP